MDASRRVVEAYRRSLAVDELTSDDANLAPVYKLDQFSNLLRTSDISTVKELSLYVLKRLDHKSPLVKQKTLRLIKYAAVGKFSAEFRREMQRNSAPMRELFHYKGPQDPLRGDALNKAVRDAAHEAVSAAFATDNSRPAAAAGGYNNKRIEGFGSTDFGMPQSGLGSAPSIKHATNSVSKADNGSYKIPTLRRSLTTEVDRHGYGEDGHQTESLAASGASKNMANSRIWNTELVSEDVNGSSYIGVKSCEERLLESIVTSGGVRLQPTRDALQALLAEALKLDAVAMSRAIENKLRSHSWQVRMKAICVLESILRKKGEEHFSIIASYFSKNGDSIVKCCELPQVSLREKANKVLSLLEGNHTSRTERQIEDLSNTKQLLAPVIQMPDLIDTGDPDDNGSEAFNHKPIDCRSGNLTPPGSLVDELFGSAPIDAQTTSGIKRVNDPFTDVSFHVIEEKEHDDVFQGLRIEDKRVDPKHNVTADKKSQSLGIFIDNSEQLLLGKDTENRNIHDLMVGLTLDRNVEEKRQSGASGGGFTGITFLEESSQPRQIPTNGAMNSLLGSNSFYPVASIQHSIPPNKIFNQTFATHPMNYGAMDAFIVQQNLLFQSLGDQSCGVGQPTRTAKEGSPSSPLPDIFQFSCNTVQNQGIVTNSLKKEETKAFDFIVDHLSAARDSKIGLFGRPQLNG